MIMGISYLLLFIVYNYNYLYEEKFVKWLFSAKEVLIKLKWIF